jgi:hypothetical protein
MYLEVIYDLMQSRLWYLLTLLTLVSRKIQLSYAHICYIRRHQDLLTHVWHAWNSSVMILWKVDVTLNKYGLKCIIFWRLINVSNPDLEEQLFNGSEVDMISKSDWRIRHSRKASFLSLDPANVHQFIKISQCMLVSALVEPRVAD